MIKLWQFTDLHLCVREDEELQFHPGHTALAQSEEIVDASLAAFLAEPDCGILLLSGDLTQSGHPDEHKRMIRKIDAVQAAGKRVYVITASHDYRTITKENSHLLREMYAPYGISESIAKYEDGLAFVVQLKPGLRLLCINDHVREPVWLDWAVAQIRQAREAGEHIFGMAHLPSLPPSPIYPIISAKSMLTGYEAVDCALADAGLRFMITGHSHMHNIAPLTTPKGNPYWDINTSALVGWPGKFRQLAFSADSVSITSREIPHVAVFGEMSTRDFLQRHFDSVLTNLFDGLDHDYDLFLRSVRVGVNPSGIRKAEWLIKPLGRRLARMTLGGFGRLLCCRRKIPKETRKRLLRDFLQEVMRNLYAGEEPYSAQTGEGQAMLAFGKRLKFLGKKIGVTDFPAFLLSIIYDEIPNDEVVIPLT